MGLLSQIIREARRLLALFCLVTFWTLRCPGRIDMELPKECLMPLQLCIPAERHWTCASISTGDRLNSARVLPPRLGLLVVWSANFFEVGDIRFEPDWTSFNSRYTLPARYSPSRRY
ncbi:hypothetical protein C2E23DRAFT_853939 [Lenzites betulinus]|nr:hypothetical protein C2E23DRAFT_853939 [Lenzites betulinus]